MIFIYNNNEFDWLGLETNEVISLNKAMKRYFKIANYLIDKT